MWEKYISEEKDASIIKDEEYKKQTRITIYHPGDIAPYEIICGIYGEMFHTVFASSMTEAVEKYEGMKKELKAYIDADMTDENFCYEFIDKW